MNSSERAGAQWKWTTKPKKHVSHTKLVRFCSPTHVIAQEDQIETVQTLLLNSDPKWAQSLYSCYKLSSNPSHLTPRARRTITVPQDGHQYLLGSFTGPSLGEWRTTLSHDFSCCHALQKSSLNCCYSSILSCFAYEEEWQALIIFDVGWGICVAKGWSAYHIIQNCVCCHSWCCRGCCWADRCPWLSEWNPWMNGSGFWCLD